MRKWIGRGVVVGVGFVTLLAALYVTCYDVPKRDIETARAKLETSKTEFQTRISNAVPGKELFKPTADAQTAAQNNTATLRSLVSRCRALERDRGDFWAFANMDRSQRTDAQWKEAEALLKEYASLLDELRAFVRNTPECASPEFTAASYNEVTQDLFVWQLRKLLTLSAQVAAHSGNVEAAVEDVACLFQLDATTASLPLAGGDARGEAQRTLVSTFPEGALTEAQSARLVALAAGALPDRRAFANGFVSDVDVFSMFLSDEFLEINARRAASSPWREAAITVSRPFRTSAVANMLATADEILALADRPYYEVRGRFEAIRQQEQRSVYTNPFALKVPRWTEFFILQVMQEARLDLLRMGLSIELYKTEHGSYPPSLDAIAANLGGTIPVDPFTGQPYQYRVSGDSFTLYSLGPDQIDQSGGGGNVAWRRM